MEIINFKIVNNLTEAEKLWKQFSPNETLYDDWDFRYCFYKHQNHELRFIVGECNNELVGLLPLQFNEKEGYLEFFSEEFMEDNRVFIKKGFEKFIPDFYAFIKEDAKAYYIIDDCEFVRQLQIEDYKYISKLEGLNNFHDYIERNFSGKSKKNLKREIATLEKNNVEIIENCSEDLETVFKFNINTFGEESNFSSDLQKNIFRDFLNLNLKHYLLSINVNGEKVAASLAIIYNDIYYLLATGSDNKKVPNVGKYLILKNIEKAINLKSKIFDVGIGDCSWKEHWKLEKISQYKFNFPPIKNTPT